MFNYMIIIELSLIPRYKLLRIGIAIQRQTKCQYRIDDSNPIW